MENQVSYGEWVRRRRKALDLTQAALARRLGCATITIRKIEAGDRQPSLEIAELLAEHLFIPYEDRETFLRMARGEYPTRVGVSTRPSRPPAFLDALDPPANTVPFVARQNELAFLFECLEHTLGGSGRPVFILGEAGSGKTALMGEFSRQAHEAAPNLLAVFGNCDAFSGMGNPFLPFRDALDMLCGGLESRWRAGTILREQALRGWRSLPFVIRTLVAEAPELLGRFVSREAVTSRAAAREPMPASWKDSLSRLVEESSSRDVEQTRLFELYEQLLRAISRRHPLILILDDLQWADAATLSLLSFLGSRLSGSRVLIIGAYRPSETVSPTPTALAPLVEEFARRFGRIRLDLDGLDIAERREFASALLDSQPNRYDESFRTTFFRQTKGNPLFSVELLYEMQERGNLVRNPDGLWETSQSVDWEELPVRTRAVIGRRLDRLEDRLQELLQLASVEGEIFTAQVLSRIQNLPERQVVDDLEEILQRRHGLVREQGEIQVDGRRLNQFRFGHALFQQYLYQQLGEGRRRLLHGEIGGALEALHEERPERIAVQLANHFVAAGQSPQAIKYLLLAGDQSRALYAHQEAIEHYRWALPLLETAGDLEGLARTWMKIGLTYQIGFDFEQAREAYARGFALWKQFRPVKDVLTPSAPHPLRMAWRDPQSLDPTMGGWNMEAPIITQLFSGLIGQSVEGEIVPDVAASWDLLEGGQRYIFHLREDVVWSDGQPVTAGDFEFTFRRALDPTTQAPVAGLLLYGVKGAREFHQGRVQDPESVGIRAVDTYTLEIELEAPTIYLLQDLSYYVLLPVPRHVVEIHGTAWAEPENLVSNGPFRLVSWERGRSMTLERYPSYHGLADGNLEGAELIMKWRADEQMALYEAGDLDVVYNWFLLDVELDPLRRRFPKEYQQRERFYPLYLIFDISGPPFDDRRVRRAFAMAIDREKLARENFLGYVSAGTGGYVPPGMPGHSPGIALPFDPAEARRSLAEAGYPGGQDFPQIKVIAATLGLVYQFIRSDVKKYLNIDFIVEIHELATAQELLAREQVHLLAGGWWADYADPDNFLRVDLRLNYPDWRDPRYEALLAGARQIQSQDERVALYREADKILIEEALIVPLIYTRTHLMMKPWVKRFDTTPVKNPGFWKDVIIDPHPDRPV